MQNDPNIQDLLAGQGLTSLAFTPEQLQQLGQQFAGPNSSGESRASLFCLLIIIFNFGRSMITAHLLVCLELVFTSLLFRITTCCPSAALIDVNQVGQAGNGISLEGISLDQLSDPNSLLYQQALQVGVPAIASVGSPSCTCQWLLQDSIFFPEQLIYLNVDSSTA